MFTFLLTGAICLAGALGVVLFRNPEDVRNVFVGGEQLKQDGRLTRLDQQAIGVELRKACAQFWSVIH